jgi:hypothetical protein
MVCLRNICVNTLHKGDSIFTNNNNNNNNNNNDNNVSTIPENHEVKELQKPVIYGTAHLLRKVLM